MTLCVKALVNSLFIVTEGKMGKKIFEQPLWAILLMKPMQMFSYVGVPPGYFFSLLQQLHKHCIILNFSASRDRVHNPPSS